MKNTILDKHQKRCICVYKNCIFYEKEGFDLYKVVSMLRRMIGKKDAL